MVLSSLADLTQLEVWRPESSDVNVEQGLSFWRGHVDSQTRVGSNLP